VARLTLLRHGLRADVYRADILSGPSVLVKHFRQASEQAVRELTSCALLRDSSDVVARVVAIDEPQRIVVFEYLTGAADLFTALRIDEPTRVLRRLGELLGRLITSTHPLALADSVATQEAAALAGAWPRVDAWAAPLNVVRPARLDATLQTLLAHHARGTPRSLTQGDPAPSNVLFPAAGAALLTDFEYGAQRPVLFDLAQWFVRCPLPLPWFEVLADTVSASLRAARVYPHDPAFRIDLARQASYAALYMFTWLPIERANDADAPWVGEWSVRQALLSTAARGALAAALAPELQALADWFGALHRVLARAWPDSGSGALDWRALVGRTPC
jgi:hypothetical protein